MAGPTLTADAPTVASFMARAQAEGVSATVLRTPAQSAITGFAQLQSTLAAAEAAVSHAALGPFPLGGSCDYDCFIGICIKTYHWNWTLDFENTRAPMQSALQQLSMAANQYTAGCAPARNWLKGTLPQFSNTFAAAAQTIDTTNAAIIAAGGKATPAQVAAVQAAFQQISDGLTQGHAEMGGAVGAVAQFTSRLQQIQGGLAGVVSGIQNNIDTAVKNAQNTFVNSMDCGQGDADNQINGAVAIFNVSVSIIQANIAQVGIATKALTASLDQFVGTLVNVSDQYANIIGQIKTAESFPTGAIQGLHLDVAAGEWQQLAQFAAQNIQ